MTTPADEIRALAARALDDSRAEQQAAHDALIRAHAYLDKHHELIALADRVIVTTVDAGEHEGVAYIIRPV